MGGRLSCSHTALIQYCSSCHVLYLVTLQAFVDQETHFFETIHFGIQDPQTEEGQWSPNKTPFPSQLNKQKTPFKILFLILMPLCGNIY